MALSNHFAIASRRTRHTSGLVAGGILAAGTTDDARTAPDSVRQTFSRS
jgi:hypothetical protein